MLAVSQAEGPTVCQAPYPALFSHIDLGQQAPIYLISGDLRTPALIDPIGGNTLGLVLGLLRY